MTAVSATDPTAPGAATPTSVANTAATLGKDQFLQLLVAQLKNQDPTSPMDGTQFAAQLAQFSTVEQLMQMNTSLTAQSAATTQGLISQQAGFANSLIGRDVILTGGKTTVDATGAARINVDLAGAAKTVHVDVLGSDGKTVLGSADVADVPAGSQTATLTLSGVPAGTYAYRVSAVDTGGKSVTVTANTIGRVDATVFQQGQVMIRVNGSVFPVTDITEIVAAAPPPASTTP